MAREASRGLAPLGSRAWACPTSREVLACGGPMGDGLCARGGGPSPSTGQSVGHPERPRGSIRGECHVRARGPAGSSGRSTAP